MHGVLAGWPLAKLCMVGGGLGFESDGLHNLLTNTQDNSKVPRGSPRLGHVAAHDWATWHLIIFQIPCRMSPANLPKLNSSLPHHHIDMPHQHLYGLYGLYSQPIFVPCLAIQIDCDISLIRCSFEPKQVALGS
jgi:hypothetical protein